MILHKPITITFDIGYISSFSNDYDCVRGVYYPKDENGNITGEIYYTPDRLLLKENKVSFDSYHFSDYSAVKLSHNESYLKAAHVRSIEKFSYESGAQSEYLQAGVDELVKEMMTKMELDPETFGPVVGAAIQNSGNLYNLTRSLAEGKKDSAITAITDITLNCLVENADKLPGLKYISAAAGSLPAVYDGIQSGDYNAAREVVLQAVSNATALKQFGDLCISITESAANVWTDNNLEDAYRLLIGEKPKSLLFQREYNSDKYKDDIDKLFTDLGGPLNAYITVKTREYCNSKGISVTELNKYPEEKKMVETLLLKKLRVEFEARYKRDMEIKAADNANMATIQIFANTGLLTRGVYGYSDDITAEDPVDRVNRLFQIRDYIERMMKNENLDPEAVFGSDSGLFGNNQQLRNANTDKHYAELIKIWLDKSNSVEGRQAVNAYIMEHYMVYVLNKENLVIEMGGKFQFKLRDMNKREIPAAGIRWTSSDPSSVSVDSSGMLTAIWPTSEDVTVEAVYQGKTYTCLVSVKDTVQLNPGWLYLTPGSSGRFTLEGITTVDGVPVWKSADESVATVSQSGTVTAVSDEENAYTEISVTFKNAQGRERSLYANVYIRDQREISQSSLSLTVGGMSTLYIQDGDGTKISGVEWESMDPNVATVDKSTGLVTAKAAGNAEIAGIASDGKGFTCEVTVSDAGSGSSGSGSFNPVGTFSGSYWRKSDGKTFPARTTVARSSKSSEGYANTSPFYDVEIWIQDSSGTWVGWKGDTVQISETTGKVTYAVEAILIALTFSDNGNSLLYTNSMGTFRVTGSK
ncbi:MAG: Ig domain-containing protein [Lachnospiraceae bacterium]|nr:Ig domain-containing protein [Lachnospiraceae bacterium]